MKAPPDALDYRDHVDLDCMSEEGLNTRRKHEPA